MSSFFENFWNGKYTLSIAAGILLGISYPPFPFPVLMFPAFVLLFRVCTLSGSGRETAYFTFIAFVLWNTIATYWLAFATIAGGVSAILANAAIMTIPFVLIRHFLRAGTHPLVMAVSVASSWTLYEFLHYRWDLAWPWLSAANAFSNSVIFVQYITFTGSLGITFWIVATSTLLYLYISTFKKKILRYALATAIVPVAVSVLMYFSYHDSPDSTMEIIVVQPNHDSYQNLSGFQNSLDPMLELLDLSEGLISDSTRLVLWPENALLSSVHEGRPGYNDRIISERVSTWGFPLITGAGYFRYYQPDDIPSVTRKNDLGQPFNIYNAAVKYQPDGNITFYGKGKLVPIVERMPFVEQVQYLPIPGIHWADASGFGRGQEAVVFEIGETALPALICYDSVFPDWVRRFVVQGAGIITVVTNDGWWGNTSGHIQHYDFARLRAIENRRAVVRSANNGISGMILPNGDIHSKTEYWTRDVLALNVPVYSDFTFYTRYGDLIGYFSLLGLIPGFIRVSSRRKLSTSGNDDKI